MYEFESTIGFVKDDSLMWNYRIIVPDDIMDHFKDTDRRIVCTINDSSELQLRFDA